MSWINSGAFKIADRNGRHYVFRRNNAGNTEINIPKTITTKAQAKMWLRNNPNKVTNPTRFKAKRGGPNLKPFERMMNGKKMIAFVNKSGKRTLLPAPGPEPTYFMNILRAQGKTNQWNFTCESLKASIKKSKTLGKGRQGVVFLASRYSNGRYPFAIKVAPRDLRAEARREPQPVDVEFKIQSAAQKCTPNVVKVFKSMRCTDFVKPEQIDSSNLQNSSHYDKSKQGLIVMEYCDGGDLHSWLEKGHKLDDAAMARLISEILGALVKIQAKYPYFRHNDLHMQNIFVANRGFLIGDFGWSRLEKTGTNPAVNTANRTTTASNYGVGPSTNESYDHHLFLNELRSFVVKNKSKFPKTIAFLDRAVPTGYRGKNDVHVKEFRLKYNDPCPGLPSLNEIVTYPFLKSGMKRVASPNIAAARAKLRKTGLKLTPARNKSVRKAPSPKKAPSLKALTNAQLLALTAANFLKLSPMSRARLVKLRAAVPKKQENPKNNLTVRRKTNATAGFVMPAKRKPFPPGILKTNKFNKLVTKLYEKQNKRANESFNNAWSRARNAAIEQVSSRINANKPPFTPSPPKVKAKTPSPKIKTPRMNFNYKLSPSSGRAKIRAPNSGRYVYANGSSISLEYLKGIASTLGVNIKGLRSKANIAARIFSAKNK
jgi:serine/threonine protein kinase